MIDGFVGRYPTISDVDGLPEGEGAFLACTLWSADALVLMGRRDDAHQLFERLLEGNRHSEVHQVREIAFLRCRSRWVVARPRGQSA